ncbi:MAG: DNA-binding protein [Oscillospiraceae bacterium]|nr:DNA-binding protein [Oscillospiraceae bacterium]
MDYRKFQDTYVIRLDRGEEIVSALTEFCRNEQILLGTVEALGASDHAVIGLYDVGEKQYHRHSFDGPMEITSLLGSITTKNGEPYLHLHINLCREDMSVIGGHLNECRISATCEMFVRKLEGVVERKLDEDGTGLNLFQF